VNANAKDVCGIEGQESDKRAQHPTPDNLKPLNYNANKNGNTLSDALSLALSIYRRCEEAKVRCCLLFDFALICQPSLKCIQFFAPIYVQVIKNVMARKDAGLVLFYWPLMMNTFNFLPPF